MKGGPDEAGNWAFLNGTQKAGLSCTGHMKYASFYGMALGVALGAAIAGDWLWIAIASACMVITIWRWHKAAHPNG
jgi:hypothetical protein